MNFKRRLIKDKIIHTFYLLFVLFSIIASIYLILIPLIKKPDFLNNILKNYYIITSPTASSYLTSWIFYSIVVFFPEKKKEKIIKKYFKNAYLNFKKNIIRQFMYALYGSSNICKVNNLMDINSFKEYFEYKSKGKCPSKDKILSNGERLSEYVDRWYALRNKIEESHYQEIKEQMEVFEKTLIPIQNNITIRHESIFIAINSLQVWLSFLQKLEPENNYDHEKIFMRNLWEFFTEEDLVGGDIYERMESLIRNL